MKSAESSWERWVPDSSESSWTLYGTVWVKLSDFRDSVESSFALSGTELSQAEHCMGQFESSLAFSGTVLSQAQRCPWLLSILWIVLSYIYLFNYFNFKGPIVCKEFFLWGLLKWTLWISLRIRKRFCKILPVLEKMKFNYE